jgi:acid phosphatase family membrane protein YuiD
MVMNGNYYHSKTTIASAQRVMVMMDAKGPRQWNKKDRVANDLVMKEKASAKEVKIL